MHDFRKIVTGLILLSVIIALVVIPLSLPTVVSADSGKKPTQPTLKIGDKVKFSKDLEATYQGIDSVSRKPIWKSVIAAPSYNSDNIKIDCKWEYVDGSHFISSANLFYADVDGEKVTINKGEMSWNPIIEFTYTDGKRIGAKYVSTILIHDYINSNYMANVLRMTYTAGAYTFYRDLRLIEGVLCEYYYLPSNPNADISINQHIQGDKEHMSSVSAWDNNNKSIKVTVADSNKRVSADDLRNVAYPVIIDPTSNYYTSASDGYLWNYDTTYSVSQSGVSSDYKLPSELVNVMGQVHGAGYDIMRILLYFDTSGLPDDATISSGTLGLYGASVNPAAAFNITVMSGMPTYPHDPMVEADFDITHYTDGGGTLTTVGLSASTYNNLTLSSTGRGWVNKTGTTKFVLASSRDISAIQPTGSENIGFYSYEQGVGYRPFLEVTYTAIAPTITTNVATSVGCNVSTMNGEVTNTGGENADSHGFVYGTTSNTTTPSSGQVPPAGYTSNWTEAGSFGIGTFSKALTGLTKGQTYYFRSFAHNSGGYSYGSDQLSWTCFNDPAIAVAAATTITTSTARLQSYLTNMGGTAAQVRFGWGTVNGGDNITAYQHYSAYEGAYETGASPYLDVTTLVASTTYYFNVEATNGCGIGHGTVTSFVTEGTVGSPTNVVALPSATEIVLSWTKGTGATNTVIRYSINSCPTSNITGTALYNGIASTYTHTGLTAGTDYCYWLTGYDPIAGYSTGNVTVHSTTVSGNGTSTLFSTPLMPTDTFRQPSAAAFETKNPVAPYLTNIANVMGFPIGNLWFVFAMIGITFFAFMAFKVTHGLEAPLVVLILGFGAGGLMGIIPGLIAAFLVPIAAAILVMKLRSNV
jgi:hypothetical protein